MAQPPAEVAPTAAAASDSTLTVEGGITLFIEPPGELFTLTGTFTKKGTQSSFLMEYHASFDDALTLGPIGDILPGITKAVGFDGVANALTEATNALKEIPGLGLILQASLKITDIGINTLSQTYQFGIALDFSTLKDPISLNGITLRALSVKVTATKETT
ncbi:MAG: hypothetical protein QNJ16_00825 [Rhodobacter sp.]|nr:hypothetical protein [Rhodobacter sp.]